MVEIIQEIRHESGVPLGGIGTGSVEIRPDGLFHEWQILNTGRWSPNSPCCRKEAVSVPPEDFVFLIRTRSQDGKTVVRYLALQKSLHDLYGFSWIRSVDRIRFQGRFPVAVLHYEDADLPVRVRAEVFSPFVPHECRVSGTPGFYVHFAVTNPQTEPVEVSVLGQMMNLAGIGQPNRRPRNRFHRDGKTASIVFSADGLAGNECTTGEMALSATREGLSWITGAFRGDRGFQWAESRYGYKHYSYLIPFRDEGELPSLDPSEPPSLPDDFRASALSPVEKRALLAELLRHPFVYRKHQVVRTAIPNLEEDEDELAGFLDDTALNLKRLAAQDWGTAALCSKVTVAPGAEEDVLFTLSWFFPNHLNNQGEKIGHMYENWFSDAEAVNRFLVQEYAEIRRKAFLVPDLLHNSSLEAAAADAVNAQLSTLVKCTWWSKENLFGVWEGLGCCGFHTMDITYQGSFPIIALFPDLQKIQMTHGAKFQRADGRVHHFFTPDFSAVDDSFERVDMNPQFVMLAARDYEWTGDREYLETLWPHIVRAMDSTALLDRDGDGLPDTDTRRNTYDAWDFAGCPAYIASLWLGALKAAVRLAREMKDEGRERQWSDFFARGVKAFDDLLWNGSYYVLWKDPHSGKVDECCMSDQLSGEWFCAVMGWGSMLPPERIRQALASVTRHNYIPDRGLINASYPPGTQPRVPTVANLQAQATWTGIEYSVASLLIEHGMADEGMRIVRDIHRRYLQAGRFWDHVECGDHYYRALSSWTVLLSLSGFRIDVPKGEVTLAPAVPEQAWVLPFFVPGAIGTVQQESRRGTSGLRVQSGRLVIKSLRLPQITPKRKPKVTLNGGRVAGKVTDDAELVFDPAIELTDSDTLEVR